MTKQEKIKEAYNNSIILEVVDENGWNRKRIFNQGEIDNEKFDYEAVGHGIYISRPKSLKGIENNNGWIKIESEDDLPKNEYVFWVIRKDGLGGEMYRKVDYFTDDEKKYWIEKITHYQPIIKPLPPIY